MTKRDVAVWFCKVWALSGMINIAFSLLSNFVTAIFSPRNGGFVLGLSNAGFSLPYLILSIFLWLFAVGIGTELAAEGEHGPPIASKADLAPLLLRCLGLTLFIAAAASLSVALLQWGYYYYSASPGFSATRVMFPSVVSSIVKGVAQSILGFLLAFTPRIRLFFGK